ncbi:MAG: potassium-transporting ATPase subunit KdpA [Thermoplasmata archaeon]|nr:potassium-transporting ATPase subunit KdpA [Thermoplasmata archaeon]
MSYSLSLVGPYLDIAIVFALVLALAPSIGSFMGRVFMNRPTVGEGVFGPIERAIYRLLGVNPRHSMRVREYAVAFLLSNAVLILWIFFLLMFQNRFPWGATPGISPMAWDLALHSASSFSTNTDFVHFVTESQVTQGGLLLGLQVAMFLSAGAGLAILAAFIRGFVRKDGTIGNYFVDITRCVVRILTPLSILGAVVLVFLGLPETFATSATVHTLLGSTQSIPLGPVASWQSIMLIGSNGGGIFGANSAHPFENPSALSNLFEIGLMMVVPFSSPFAFASAVRRKGEALPFLGTILIVFFTAVALVIIGQIATNPDLSPIAALSQGSAYPVGQETRFTLPEGALFQTVSVYANVGANNMAIGALSPIGQMAMLFGMFTQSTPGGVGTGMGYLLTNALIAIFVGGLMVGRTPEYLGKKIGRQQIGWAASLLLVHPVLIFTPLVATLMGGFVPPLPTAVGASAHTFTSILYEFTSEAANNGSGMGSVYVNDATLWFNVVGAVVMLIGRFFPMIAMLMISHYFSVQSPLPPGPGTLKTQSFTFTIYLTLFLIILTALLFLPALALGPLTQIGGG